jgi:hypothetical protein
MAGRGLLKLKQLTFDGPHSRHEAIELAQEKYLVLLGFLDQVGGRAVADPVKSVSQLHIQEPHGLFQIQKLLMQLTLLEHAWIPQKMLRD